MDWVQFEKDVTAYFGPQPVRFMSIATLYEYLHRSGINVESKRRKQQPGSEKLTKAQRRAVALDPRKLRQIAWEYKISVALVHRIKKIGLNSNLVA